MQIRARVFFAVLHHAAAGRQKNLHFPRKMIILWSHLAVILYSQSERRAAHLASGLRTSPFPLLITQSKRTSTLPFAHRGSVFACYARFHYTNDFYLIPAFAPLPLFRFSHCLFLRAVHASTTRTFFCLAPAFAPLLIFCFPHCLFLRAVHASTARKTRSSFRRLLRPGSRLCPIFTRRHTEGLEKLPVKSRHILIADRQCNFGNRHARDE